MSSSFSQLKKTSANSLDSLSSELGKLNAKTSYEDDRYWKLDVDKAQNGHAIIRFLPASTGESVPWVRYWQHSFQGPGGWYIENSLTTLGQDDPVSEYNSAKWNSGIPSDKDIARKQKRQIKYVSNIFVVSDPANPENEGKNFLYRYGKSIFDIVNDKMQPQFEDDTPVNPFDLWAGCNFRLRARQKDGYRSYDKSDFDSTTPLFEDDAELERVWNSQHSLQEVVAPDQFKSYDELKTRFNLVIGESDVSSSADDGRDPIPQANYEESVSTDEDDGGLDYFKKLAENS
jgi:hypothetical protein